MRSSLVQCKNAVKSLKKQTTEIVDKILMEGTAKAQKTAKETMKKVKKAMKLDY